MIDVRAAVRRLYNSSVVWTWAINGFRVAGGLLLLPLLLRVLPREDLGMYYVFLSLYALLPVVDFGFSVSVTRYVGYAMGGATELKPQGLVHNETSTAPNYLLLWQLLHTTRSLFRTLSLLAFVIVSIIGTWAVGLRVEETSTPSITWLAWGVTVVSLVLEIFAGWWNHFLRGMNEVLLSSRIAVLAYGLKLVIAGVLLLVGGGLLAFPAAGLVTSLLQRYLSRRCCLARLQGAPQDQKSSSLLKILWPNSWRVGLQYLSTYLATNANALICLKVFGLAANAQYGLSLQVAQVSMAMAYVWIFVKLPLITQYCSQRDLPKMRRVLWPRFWLQTFTYLALAAAAFWLGPAILQLLGTNKQLLPSELLALILVTAFFDMQFSFWTTLLTLENRIPYLWPTIASNIGSLILVLCMLNFTSIRIGALILAPLIMNSLFNYWYWPLAAAKTLRTSLFKFLFSPPSRAQLDAKPDKMFA
jgi:O-antigen/teichoic acid export membrane protein